MSLCAATRESLTGLHPFFILKLIEAEKEALPPPHGCKTYMAENIASYCRCKLH